MPAKKGKPTPRPGSMAGKKKAPKKDKSNSSKKRPRRGSY